MTQANGQKSSVDIEREVVEQRGRVEARIGEIRDRLSPGQLVDEVLSYTKDGGGKFAANFGQQITANPLPAALVGVGLVWLIASNANSGQVQAANAGPSYFGDYDDYPYAKVSGGLKRVSHAPDESGQWWTEFEGSSGERFKARADSRGHRAGHFTDTAGKKFSGFIDEAGNRVRQFQDESGNALDDAMGWASHSWRDTQNALGRQMDGVRHAASHFAGDVTSQARHVGGQVGGTAQAQADQLARQVSSLFNQQPLIAGALAFAAGAALGAALPHTAQEDEVLGEQADKVRSKATATAGELYQQGKEQATKVYEDVSDKAEDLYAGAKDKVLGSTGTTNLH